MSPLDSYLNWIMARRAERIANRLDKYINIGETCLDIGCGTGHNARELSKRGHGPIFETDITNMRTLSGRFAIASSSTLPFQDETFDCVTLIHVLNYSSQPEQLFREIYRVTKYRLILLQSTFATTLGYQQLRCRDFVEGRFAFRIATFLRCVPKGPSCMGPYSFYTRKDLENLISRTPWSITKRILNKGRNYLPHRDLMILEKK